MPGLNERLIAAFPQIGEAMPSILARRQAFRDEHVSLSFAQQDEVWQQRYPGTTSHSQLDIYRSLAPETFDTTTTTAVKQWLRDPDNFGFAEYPDTPALFEGLRRIGVPAVIFTLGDPEFWQPIKLDSAPSLRGLPRHITDTLPLGGKGEVVANTYDSDADAFRFPRTDGGEPIEAKGAVMVDDSMHNVTELPPQALGVLVDRKGRHLDSRTPPNVEVVRSLDEVPALVERYAAMRKGETF
jgi:FMN phosphatase YigB (HAD superfamily)